VGGAQQQKAKVFSTQLITIPNGQNGNLIYRKGSPSTLAFVVHGKIYQNLNVLKLYNKPYLEKAPWRTCY
jgi:hypothetical protein